MLTFNEYVNTNLTANVYDKVFNKVNVFQKYLRERDDSDEAVTCDNAETNSVITDNVTDNVTDNELVITDSVTDNELVITDSVTDNELNDNITDNELVITDNSISYSGELECLPESKTVKSILTLEIDGISHKFPITTSIAIRLEAV